jgi:hypothetical protein
MAIIENKLNIATPFYKSFVPFRQPQETIATNNIFDMVSVNYIQPQRDVIINQTFGASEVYTFIIRIKNITNNAKLSVQLNNDNFFIVEEKNFILEPNETKNITITANNLHINEQSDKLFQKSNIKIIVKNITNELTYINQNVIRLDPDAFPDNIEVR